MEFHTQNAVLTKSRAPVLTKSDFVRRYQAGEFGNASPTWDSIQEYLDWVYPAIEMGTDLGPEQLYHIRNRVASGTTYYDVPEWELVNAWHNLLGEGVKPESLYISAMAPTHLTLFQGEVCQSPQHLWLRYSTLPFTMREALSKKQHHEYGIMAVQLLRRYLCPNSYDWLNYLLSAYPGHVVEFSTYATNWGTIPGFNTVFWEIRNY